MEFWETISTLQKIYFCLGLAASVFLVLQIITMLFGLGGGGDLDVDAGDLDVDLSGDVDIDGDVGNLDVDAIGGDAIADGFNLFTFRGLIAFFAIGGWTGFALAEVNLAISIVGALIAGTLALVAMGLMMRGIMKLRSNGNIDNSKAVGHVAEVYLTIPAKGNGSGKINLTLEERFVELDAIQEGSSPIPTGAKVVVTAILGSTLVVEEI